MTKPKSIIITIVTFALILGCKSLNIAKTDSHESIIKSIKQVAYKVNSDTNEKLNRDELFVSEIDQSIIYDLNEKPIEIKMFNPNGSLYQKTEYTRDSKGQPTKGLK